MAISSASKVTSKLFYIAASPSIQSLLRPAATASTTTHLFQSPVCTTMHSGADPRLFNLLQSESDRSDSARISNLREISFALNSVAPPFSYSAAKKQTSIDSEPEEEDFSGEEDEDDLDYSPELDDTDGVEEDEEDEEEIEEEAPRRKPRK